MSGQCSKLDHDQFITVVPRPKISRLTIALNRHTLDLCSELSDLTRNSNFGLWPCLHSHGGTIHGKTVINLIIFNNSSV
jgi:hypothetical protein